MTYGGHENWDDETVLNYEIGAKTRWADDRVTFNAAVFMSEIDGLQVIADAGILLLAHHPQRRRRHRQGAEIELYVRPDDALGFRPVGDVHRSGNHRVAAGQRAAHRRHS